MYNWAISYDYHIFKWCLECTTQWYPVQPIRCCCLLTCCGHVADLGIMYMTAYVYLIRIHTHISQMYMCMLYMYTHIYISTWNQIISIDLHHIHHYIYIYTDMYSHGSHHDLSRNAPSRHSLRPLRHYWWWLARQAPFSQFSQGKRWKRHGKTAHLSGSIIICR